MGIAKRILKIAAVGLFGLAAAAVALVAFMPRQQIVSIAAERLHEATGRNLTVAGEISTSLWPVPGVRMEGVSISNADWAAEPVMISAGAVEVGVALLPLLSGAVVLDAARLIDPVIHLERDAEGRANWELARPTPPDVGAREPLPAAPSEPAPDDAAPEPAAPADDALAGIALPTVEIVNGTVTLDDAIAARSIRAEALDLTASLPDPARPFEAEGRAVWNGKPVKLRLFADNPAAAMAGREVTLRLVFDSAPAALDFDGRVTLGAEGVLPAVSGRIEARARRLSNVVAWAGGAAPPEGLRQIAEIAVEGTVDMAETGLAAQLAGSARLRGRDVSLELAATGGAGWQQSQKAEIDLQAEATELAVAGFRGPVDLATLSASGPLSLEVANLRGLVKLVTGKALVAPQGTLRTLSLAGRLDVEDGVAIAIADARAALDGAEASGTVTADLTGEKPFVAADLTAGDIDVTPFLSARQGRGKATGSNAAQEDGSPQTPAKPRTGAPGGWSRQPLDLSALEAVDADLALKARSVRIDKVTLGQSDVAARLRDGALSLAINRVATYGGAVTGTIGISAGEVPKITTDLRIAAVQLRPFLAAMAGVDDLEGLGALRLKLTGRGRSLQAVMANLAGSGAIELTDGAILGVNLVQLVRNITGEAGGPQRTDFSSVSGTFKVRKGVLHNADFAFLGPLIRILGGGTVDIGKRRQNFRLTPKAVSSLTGQGGVLNRSGLEIFPVIITGTWENPQIELDLAGAVENILSDPTAAAGTIAGATAGRGLDLTGDAAGGVAGGVAGGLGALLGALTGDEPATEAPAAGTPATGTPATGGATPKRPRKARPAAGSAAPATSIVPRAAPPRKRRVALARRAGILPRKARATADKAPRQPAKPNAPAATEPPPQEEDEMIRAIDGLFEGLAQ